MTDQLRPPWVEYPEYPRYSLGWRMGDGEDYIYRWGEWFATLSDSEVDAYALLYPEPLDWRGFYSFEKKQRRPKPR